MSVMNPHIQTEETRDRPLKTPSLTAAWRAFVHHRSPRILVALLGVLLGLRFRAGDLTPWDLLVVAGANSLHPFVEWVIHVFILHAQPRKVGGGEVDLRIARYHRYHHRDPWDLRWVFMPLPEALIALGIQMTIMGLVLPIWPLRLMGMTAVAGLGLMYEWTHFLTHTTYRPRSTWFRKIWRYHRLHHFKNENYWYGVTMHLGDHMLGTLPDKDAVPTSGTARDLGRERDLGDDAGPDA